MKTIKNLFRDFQLGELDINKLSEAYAEGLDDAAVTMEACAANGASLAEAIVQLKASTEAYRRDGLREAAEVHRLPKPKRPVNKRLKRKPDEQGDMFAAGVTRLNRNDTTH